MSKTYRLQVVTKLGSQMERTIVADDEAAAIKAMNVKFPMAETISVLGDRLVEELENVSDMKEYLYFDPEKETEKLCQEGRNKMIIGGLFMLFGLGILLLMLIGSVGLHPVFLILYLVPGYGAIDFRRGYILWKMNNPDERAIEKLRNEV
ncbi:hypothetical protein MLD52_16585 [Puniceicoccaceae bacterium K14]|nr:hypothetical protein [Puniceicoccaceae bacterium K14]